MGLYEQLAIIYVEKNTQPNDEPEKLLAMYREAYEKITQCDKQHDGRRFSFE